MTKEVFACHFRIVLVNSHVTLGTLCCFPFSPKSSAPLTVLQHLATDCTRIRGVKIVKNTKHSGDELVLCTNTHDCLLQLLRVLMLKATSTSLTDLNPGTLEATGTISDPNTPNDG